MARKDTKIYTCKDFSGTLPEACDHFGVSYYAIYQRMQKGINLDEAIDAPTQKRNKIYTYKGFSGILSEICKHFDINIGTVSFRIKNGMSLEESIGTPVGKIYTYKDFSGNLKEVCEHFGINYGTVKSRIKKGMNLEESIEVKLPNPSLKRIYKYNYQHSTVRELCGLNNKDFISVYNLMKSNHTIEWAIEHGEEKV